MMLHIHDLYLCGSDLQPYIHAGVFRRDRVFMSARFQCEASPFIGKHCHISGRVKGNVRQWKECPAVFLIPFPDRMVIKIVFPFHVPVSFLKKSFVEISKACEAGRRNQKIPPDITDLVFHAAFVPAGLRVHKAVTESVVLTET